MWPKVVKTDFNVLNIKGAHQRKFWNWWLNIFSSVTQRNDLKNSPGVVSSITIFKNMWGIDIGSRKDRFHIKDATKYICNNIYIYYIIYIIYI